MANLVKEARQAAKARRIQENQKDRELRQAERRRRQTERFNNKMRKQKEGRGLVIGRAIKDTIDKTINRLTDPAFIREGAGAVRAAKTGF